MSQSSNAAVSRRGDGVADHACAEDRNFHVCAFILV
jgi:hypothetical protein